MIFYSAILGFLSGVLLFSLFPTASLFSWQQILLGACVSLGICLCALLSYQNKVLLVVGIGLLFSLGGIARTKQVINKSTNEILEQYIEQHVVLQGRILGDPDERQTHTRMIVQPLVINNKPLNTNSRVLVTTSPYTIFEHGDMIQITGKLRRPEDFETDTGRTFYYANYLAKDDIYQQISFAEITLLERSSRNIKRMLFYAKDTLVASIDRLFAQPEGALLGGVLFGEQAGLGNTLQDNFRRTGVVHIVVLSGFNVTIIALFIVWLLGRIAPQRIALLCGVIGIALFVVLVGAGATIVRAGVMAILALVARVLGRESQIIRALCIAAFLMVAHNPKILLHDVSFQLSFLATLGIVYAAPVFDRWLRIVPEAFTLRETIVGTLAAQIFVTPLLLYAVGEFSIVAPITNVLVVPLVPISMFLGFVASLFGLVSHALGMVIMVPAYFILHFQIKIVSWFGSLSFASITIPQFPIWLVIVSYAVLLLAFVRKNS